MSANGYADAETFEALWEYCNSNKRLIPKDWNGLYNMLRNKKQKASGGWEPSLPLILGAWHDTIPIEKQLRFKEHVQWANDNHQIDEIGCYLRALPEEEWYHFGEI
jgi:hypothetical protein